MLKERVNASRPPAEAPPPTGRVALWHPADAAAAERDAGHDRLADLQVKQPFKQAFRERYILSPDERADATTGIFADHVVAVTPLLGVARRERWQVGDECLTRSFGR